jgi:hypothetical protein
VWEQFKLRTIDPFDPTTQESYRGSPALIKSKNRSAARSTHKQKRCCLESRSGGPSCYRKSVLAVNTGAQSNTWHETKQAAKSKPETLAALLGLRAETKKNRHVLWAWTEENRVDRSNQRNTNMMRSIVYEGKIFGRHVRPSPVLYTSSFTPVTILIAAHHITPVTCTPWDK